MFLSSTRLQASNHELVVESGSVGSLDSVIYADTLPNGDRADPDRIYVLKRSTKYILSQTIDWIGFALRIAAEKGNGARPMILFDQTMFRINYDTELVLKSVHINGKLTENTNSQRPIRMVGNKARVKIDDCIFDETGQSHLRLQADSLKISINNSIFTRIGDPIDPDNGRFIDNRGFLIDTVVISNCIVYSATSRFFNNWPGSHIKYGCFNHNTFWASGQYGFTFRTVDELYFTNNIVCNPVFLGETDLEAKYAMVIDTFILGETIIEVNHNNFFTSPEFDALLPDTLFSGDSVHSVNGDFFGPHILNAIVASGMGATNINEELSFNNPPNVPAQFIAASAEESYDNAGVWDFSDLTPFANYSEPGIDRYAIFHDFSYPNTAMSYTAGNDGQPLGAHLNFCNYPINLELSLDTLPNGNYIALDSIILHGTNMIADSLQFISKNIIELRPVLEGQVGKEIILKTNTLLCDEFVR